MANLTGTNGNDTLKGEGQDDTLRGLGGADTLLGRAGGDLAYGGDGNDNIYGQDGNDRLAGQGGNDRVYGDAGNDRVYGSEGDDVLFGGPGDDYIEDFFGANQILLGSEDDQFNGGYRLGESPGSKGNTIYGAAGYDHVAGGNARDVIYAGDDDDSALGGAGDDVIYGQSGDDFLSGDIGNDIVVGGLGNDTLEGRDGRDVLTGNVGEDTFLFYQNSTDGGDDPGNSRGPINDLITDFVNGQDELVISFYAPDSGTVRPTYAQIMDNAEVRNVTHDGETKASLVIQTGTLDGSSSYSWPGTITLHGVTTLNPGDVG